MILVGTDLSLASRPALLAAAALGRKRNEDLTLVTVVEPRDAAARIMADVRLEQDAAELRRDFDVSVECVVTEGAADARLLELAKARAASLLVVGAEGKAKRSRRVGSVAERLCQLAKVPVLVARDSERWLAWGRDSAPLRVLVGSGMGDASKSALAEVAGWPDLALHVAHVAWPYGEHYRLGVSGPMPLDHLRPELHHQLLQELADWTRDVPCRSAPRLNVAPGWGRVDTHLAQLAEENEADLLVVGSHQRNLSERVWHGCVSRNALHEARCSVLCVPNKPLETLGEGPRVFVVPTDFSVLADRAVRVAYSMAAPGSVVHLVFVAKDQTEEQSELQAKLSARIPPAAKRRGVATELALLKGDPPWLAIWQYSGRVGASLICMATHSRAAVANLILGSQAHALLEHSRIPVLLVPPDRES